MPVARASPPTEWAAKKVARSPIAAGSMSRNAELCPSYPVDWPLIASHERERPVSGTVYSTPWVLASVVVAFERTAEALVTVAGWVPALCRTPSSSSRSCPASGTRDGS